MIIMLLFRYEALFPLALFGLMFVWVNMEQEALQHYGLSLKPKVTALDRSINLIHSFLGFFLSVIDILSGFQSAMLCISFRFGKDSISCFMN